VADNRHHVPDGTVGFVVPPGDAAAMSRRVVELLRDPARRTTMGAAGRQHAVTRYSLATMAAAMGAVYERVLSGRRRTG
jgi:glycosyltransferase involved in cell wall biosynthesis